MKNGKALDVKDNKDVEGQAVTVATKGTGRNQQWNVIYVDKAGKEDTNKVTDDYGIQAGRPFYIMSRMYMQRVLYYQAGKQMKIMSL